VYRGFYRWGSIWRGGSGKPADERLPHLAYAGVEEVR
jgi:hypothetical protein